MSSSYPVRLVSWMALRRLGGASQGPANALAALAAEESSSGLWVACGLRCPFRCCARHWGCFGISAVDKALALSPQAGTAAGTQEYGAGLAAHSRWHGLARKLPCLPGDCAWVRGVCWEAKSHVQLKALVSSRQEQTSRRVPCSTRCSDIRGQPGSFH